MGKKKRYSSQNSNRRRNLRRLIRNGALLRARIINVDSPLSMYLGSRVEIGTEAGLITGVLADVKQEYIHIVEDRGNQVYIPLSRIDYMRPLFTV